MAFHFSDTLPSDSRMDQLLTLGIAYLSCDADLVITGTSAHFAELLGLDDTQIAERPLLDVCLPLVGSEPQITAIAKGDLSHIAIEQINVERDDATIAYISLVVLAQSPGLLLVLSDVTAQSQQQQRLQQQQHELLLLHETVARQNQQLTDLNRELTELSQRKSDLLAIATHDLRSPLSAIISLAEMLQRGIFGSVSTKQYEAVDAIYQQGGRMLELINSLLNLRRLEIAELPHRPVNLSLLVEQTKRSFTDQAQLANVMLASTMCSELVMVAGDSELLQQAIANLVSNAIKYASGAMVSLDLGFVDAMLTPALPDDATQQWCVLEVRDTGPGIAEGDLQKIFDPFFRTSASRLNGLSGNGLGLSIVQTVVQQHRGRITVESTLGKGTAFALFFPCLAA